MDQKIFVGKSKEMKRWEHESSRAFETMENNLSFPLEHYTSFMISRESKNLLQPLVSNSFAEASGDYAVKFIGWGALPSVKRAR